VQPDHCHLAGRSGITLPRGDRDALMQVQHILDSRGILEFVDECLLGRTGVTEDVFDPRSQELLDERRRH
jgi:hypothetical protein